MNEWIDLDSPLANNDGRSPRNDAMTNNQRRLIFETLESKCLLAGDAPVLTGASWHNPIRPADVDADGAISPHDALIVITWLGDESTLVGYLPSPPSDNRYFVDVNNDFRLSPLDALLVVNELGIGWPPPVSRSDSLPVGALSASFNDAEALGSQNLLTTTDVQTLLQRAAMVSRSTDAIIAVVDRSGRILGVRVEAGVDASLQSDPQRLAFAIDGAVAKARTAAFFSSNAAPLTSRTIRFISQSTMTQREVESSPQNPDPRYRGPGFVAPIGVGGHFPPEVRFTPQVDLFAIEHQSRDRSVNAGLDGMPGTSDDFTLTTRFNVDPNEIADGAEAFFETWPESYGFQAGTSPEAQARGIATLPGGVPLYKVVTDSNGIVQSRPGKTPDLPDINLVGGIGVFFPGPDGFATFEQGFVHASQRGGRAQSEYQRTNANRVLESEFIALVAAAGNGQIVGPSAFARNLSEFNDRLPPLPLFTVPNGRIDLVGITLEIFGPTPSREFRIPGIDRLIQFGTALHGPGTNSGIDVIVSPGTTYLAGQPVPEGWLVRPHDAGDGSLSASQVRQIIQQGIDEAEQVRAAIRLEVDNGFRPGARTRMVLAVADTSGNVLGLFRMPDATVFSVDVAVAKSRNTAYYADATLLQAADRVDFNGSGDLVSVSQSLDEFGNTVPPGTALTNRTFRFLAEPRFPTGIELDQFGTPNVSGLVNSPMLDLCDQQPLLCQLVGPQSTLRRPGINPLTAENLVNAAPLDVSVYTDPFAPSTLAFDAFVPSRNFRDPGDASVIIQGTGIPQPLANQNGVVFFPGSTALYNSRVLVGGFGVSGDGVDQDDVVTSAGAVDFAAPAAFRVDEYVVGFVRLPYLKFNRNPLGQ